MKIDVFIEYDKKLSEVTFSSQTTRFSETRAARLGLSHLINEDLSSELIEFVGADWKTLKNIPELFEKDPTRKNYILRVINPFESSTFEPEALFRMVDHFSMIILSQFYPKTWLSRRIIARITPWLDIYEMTLKIPDYKLFEPRKKAEFEKLPRTEYKNVTFVS